MGRWTAAVAGIIAILALTGVVGLLPHHIGFFACSLAVILFPGMALAHLVAGGTIGRYDLPQRLAIWFTLGAGLLTAFGLAGLAFQLRLSDLVPVIVGGYAGLAAILVLKRAATAETDDGNATANARPAVPAISLVLIFSAVGLALLTLITPRDYDDWYYLAYIKDYVAGAPLASEDAIFGMGNPAASRIWFGGGWWVLEALLARVSGIDPIACHQTYLPVLLLPFAVFAVWALAREVFHSAWAALLACGFQVLFYLSSAYPYKSAGWMVFARIAQDKAVSCFVVVPVAAALALRLTDRAAERITGQRGLVALYWIAVLTSVLVHGMGAVWAGLFIVPLALVEWSRTRTRQPTAVLGRVLLPLCVCAVILISARGVVRDLVTAPVQEVIHAPGALSNLYLPGTPFSLGTDTTNPVTWVVRESFRTLNPLFIFRYPLAIAGLVLTFGLFRYFRSSVAARFLLALTIPTLALLFTPPGIALTGWFVTPRLVFRLAWIFPWGFTVALFLVRVRLRPLLCFIVLAVIVLTLARGNPGNYAASFLRMRDRNRPSPDAAEAFEFLAAQPSPQGVILASEATGRMIPAFLPGGYPVNFREFGPVGSEHLKEIIGQEQLDRASIEELERLRVHYILIENTEPLAAALRDRTAGFVLRYENASYSVWESNGRPGERPAGLKGGAEPTL